jgi:hypothetical protein
MILKHNIGMFLYIKGNSIRPYIKENKNALFRIIIYSLRSKTLQYTVQWNIMYRTLQLKHDI